MASFILCKDLIRIRSHWHYQFEVFVSQLNYWYVIGHFYLLRYSCGSGTPVSSDSSSTSRSPSPPPSPAPSPLVPLTVVPRAPPPPVPLPLDLLTEMELLFPERRSPPKDTDKAVSRHQISYSHSHYTYPHFIIIGLY